MKHRSTCTRAGLAILGSVSLTLAATACGSSGKNQTTTTTAAATTTTAGAQVAAPIIVDLASANGTTVSAKVGATIVLNAQDPTKWTATIANPNVVTFVAGSDDGSAQFNPGLTAVAAGTTEVALTNGAETVTITVVIA